jgi:hypothetical protein
MDIIGIAGNTELSVYLRGKLGLQSHMIYHIFPVGVERSLYSGMIHFTNDHGVQPNFAMFKYRMEIIQDAVREFTNG